MSTKDSVQPDGPPCIFMQHIMEVTEPLPGVSHGFHGDRALFQLLDPVGHLPGLRLVAPRVRLLLRVSVSLGESGKKGSTRGVTILLFTGSESRSGTNKRLKI